MNPNDFTDFVLLNSADVKLAYHCLKDVFNNQERLEDLKTSIADESGSELLTFMLEALSDELKEEAEVERAIFEATVAFYIILKKYVPILVALDGEEDFLKIVAKKLGSNKLARLSFSRAEASRLLRSLVNDEPHELSGLDFTSGLFFFLESLENNHNNFDVAKEIDSLFRSFSL